MTGDVESTSDKLQGSTTALDAQSYCFETGSFHIALPVLELARPYNQADPELTEICPPLPPDET